MKIAIIGGGYTGLAAAYYLSKKGNEVVLFEKDKTLGGLASGFKDKSWKWSLEKYYHHIFASDHEIIKLAKEVGCPFSFSKPKTSIYYSGRVSSFRTPIDLVQFSHIPVLARLRTGFTILALKFIPNWKPLEKITAIKFIQKTSGNKACKVIWLPLFKAKFDKDINKIPASWFWARIKKRGNVFGYPRGGFDKLTSLIVKKAKKRKAKFLIKTMVKSINIDKNKIKIKTNKGVHLDFDKAICTLPGETFAKIAPSLPLSYAKKLTDLKGKGTINLVLSLKKKFLTDGTFWLNVNDTKFPFIGVIEQTNHISKSKYNNDNIIYIANYLPPNHPFFKADKKFLIRKFSPYLKKINPEFDKKMIRQAWIFKSTFAQPVMTLNYSKKIPPFETPIKNVYLANMQQVYPWDRQTNYAVELGKRIGEIVSRAS